MEILNCLKKMTISDIGTDITHSGEKLNIWAISLNKK